MLLPSEEHEKEKSPDPQLKKRKNEDFFVDLYEEYKKEKLQAVQLTAASLIESVIYE
jgi:hypothetical protein